MATVCYNLSEAEKHGNYTLLKNNITPNDDKIDEYLLHACQCKKAEAPLIIKHLLNNGADPNIWFLQNGMVEEKVCTLFESVQNPSIGDGDEQTIKMLLAKCQGLNDQDKTKRTLLHYAVKRQKKEFCTELIRKGAQTDIPNCNGRTAYHVAAEKENGLEIFKLLLQSETKETWLNQPDSYGKTPLHCAVYAGNTNIVEILLEKGSSVNISAGNGATCLHIAIEQGYRDMVDVLIKNGAEANTRLQNGDTPLILAAKLRHGYTIDIVKVLLENGADLKLANNKNETAITAAKKDGLNQITEFLQKSAGEEKMNIGYPNCDLKNEYETNNIKIAQIPSFTFKRICKHMKKDADQTLLARELLEKCLNIATQMHEDIIIAFHKTKYKKIKWLEVFLKYFWKDYTEELSKHQKYSLLKISMEESGLMSSKIQNDLQSLETYAKGSYNLPGNENDEKGHWRLASELGSNWQYLASQLDCKQPHMEQIQEQYGCQQQRAAMMLIRWQQRTGYKGQEMLNQLRRCLNLCERADLAENLKEFYGH